MYRYLILFLVLFCSVEARQRRYQPQRYGYLMVADSDKKNASLGLGFRTKHQYFGSDASYTFYVYPFNKSDFNWDLRVFALCYPFVEGPYLGLGAGYYPTLQQDKAVANSKPDAVAWRNNLLLYGRIAIGYEWGDQSKRFVQISGITRPTLSLGFSF